MRIKTLQLLERVFSVLARVFEQAREAVAVCPDCGRNRYKGAPCVKGGR